MDVMNSDHINTVDSMAEIMQRDEEAHIKSVVENELPERLSKVIVLRFFEHMTLKDAAKVLNVTRERVRMMEAKALRHLRHPCRLSKLQGLI